MSSIIVFGATGISGLAALEALIATDAEQYKEIFAVSRRVPKLSRQDDRVRHISVDLLGPTDELASSLDKAGAQGVTHALFYAYIAKDDERELIDVNRKLFQNSLDALSRTTQKLDVVLLQTGYKFYGVHKGGDKLATIPFREDAPMHKGENFYFVQEDMLKSHAARHKYHWIISRPNFIIGTSKGNFMSLGVTLGLYAATSKYLNRPLVFPGSDVTYNLKYDFSSSQNNAKFQLFAIRNPKAYDSIFNIHDGTSYTWAEIWEKTARYFGLELTTPAAAAAPLNTEVGKDIVALHSAETFASTYDEAMDAMIKDNGLDRASKDHVTWAFLDFATTRTWSDLGSLDEARRIGFSQNFDTWEDGFKAVFDAMRESKLIL